MKLSFDIYESQLPRKHGWNCWQEFSDDLHYQWERLTREDLEKIRINQEKIAAILQQRYGFNDRQAEKAVNNFLKYQRYNVQAD